MAAIKTFSLLCDEVMNYLDQAGEDGTTRAVVEDTIRGVHNARVTERKWNFMLYQQPQTLTTIVGQRLYSLHGEFFRPLYFWNSTAKRYLVQHTEVTLQQQSPAGYDFDVAGGGGVEDWTTAQGSASSFKFAGISPVKFQPSGGVLHITGSSLSTMVVEGEAVLGGERVPVTETLTEGTPGSVIFARISGYARGGTSAVASAGLWEGSTVLAYLPENEWAKEYRQIELLTTPTSAETITYQFYRRPRPLLRDNDLPDIPSPFARLLVYDALIQLGAYNNNMSAAAMRLWQMEQTRLENGLLEYDAGQDAVAAQPSYTTYISRD